MISSGIMEIDIHGMTRTQARDFLKMRIQRAGKGVYRIRVIHGFHGGTELRDLVRRELAKEPKVIRCEFGMNQGETELVLREYF